MNLPFAISMSRKAVPQLGKLCNAPCVVIQGSNEKAKGEVTIKDLIVGAELAKLEKGREEHLQKQAEAQRAVPEAQLVEAVRAVLARHKLGPR
jgi:histidyl-tRNA synthetase